MQDVVTIASSQTLNLTFLGGFLLDDKDFFAFIVSAMRADMVRQARLVAIGAGDEVGGCERQVTAPAVAPSFREFPFG